jgi:hypothetical protein
VTKEPLQLVSSQSFCRQPLPIPAITCSVGLLAGCSVGLPAHAHSTPIGEML